MVAARVVAHPRTGPPPARALPAANRLCAQTFERIAELLEARNANARRVLAYRRGAAFLRRSTVDVATLWQAGGSQALVELPTIGTALASEIAELLETGRLRMLERLEERASPQKMLTAVQGIGPTLAKRIVDTLQLNCLEDLEMAAHDGRLAAIPGFGQGRLKATRHALREMLSRSTRNIDRQQATPPDVTTLLELDEEYRKRANSGRLHRIAPRRFNPQQQAWLSVMHVDHDGYSFTLMYSNTARAHRLGMTRDWVVVEYRKDGLSGRCTIVTETRGPDEYLRVIRGREGECHAHHILHPPPPMHFAVPVF
jgi:DNA polymerase (family 10)